MISAMIRQLQQFFEISRKEARATLALVTITFVLLWTPFIFRRFVLPRLPLKTEKYDTAKLDSLAAQIDKAAEKTDYRQAESNDRQAPASQVRVRLFRFDPNEASTDELAELGVPVFLQNESRGTEVKAGNSVAKKTCYAFMISLPASIKNWSRTLFWKKHFLPHPVQVPGKQPRPKLPLP